jgi:uncharacterized membrane protein YhaH (DUF805 family)
MTFTDSVRSCINKYATFSGRASRSEFWWFWLFIFIVQIVSLTIFSVIGYLLGGYDGCTISLSICSVLCILLLTVPYLSVLVRRLHDTNHSGWWYFISLIPLIGTIWMIILLATDSDEENKYGLPVY